MFAAALAAAPTGLAAQDQSVTLLAVGDMADCNNPTGVKKVSDLLESTDHPIAALGDLVYPAGTRAAFDECFDPSFGDVAGRMRPTPGNHEYSPGTAAAYFERFGEAAGPDQKGWYAYDLGTWRVISLNSNCWEIGGCREGSEQHDWLLDELAAHPNVCRIAYWHHPRFSSSGRYGNANFMQPISEALTAAGTELILSGHAHHYERFARLDADGVPHPDAPRYFTVGTGGTFPRGFGNTQVGSEVRKSGVYGALELTLEPNEWSWSFQAQGGRFSDSGAETCRAAEGRADDRPLAGDNSDAQAIRYLYRAAFGREPDAQGNRFWLDQLQGGRPIVQVSDEFSRSPEFVDLYGTPNNREFVDLLYRNVLDREPDAAGASFWLERLRTQSRAELLLEFSFSAEFRAN